MSKHPPLNLPPIDSRRLTTEGGVEKIFDPLRRKWVVCTPEEWVRQHFVEWLVCCKGYSPYKIANEAGIKLNGMVRRCDTVIYDSANSPDIIVEYKAPSVEITQRTFDQIARYNMVLRARLLIVSNGLKHYCCCMDYDRESYCFLPDIPEAD